MKALVNRAIAHYPRQLSSFPDNLPPRMTDSVRLDDG